MSYFFHVSPFMDSKLIENGRNPYNIIIVNKQWWELYQTLPECPVRPELLDSVGSENVYGLSEDSPSCFSFYDPEINRSQLIDILMSRGFSESQSLTLFLEKGL